jgi:pimeloyl-ACP methyl ester carboxylesterase
MPGSEAAVRAAEARLWTSLGVAPEETRIRLAHAGSEVRVQVCGAGEPVVFLHGASTWGSSWADLVAALPDVRSYVVDRPGAGLSGPLGRPVRDVDDLLELADHLLPDLLDGLGLATVSLVATSFGGYFALRGTLAVPQRVRRLVLFGWPTGAPLGRMPLAMRLGAVPGLGSVMARMPVNDRAVRTMFRGIGLRQAVDAGRVSPEAIAAYAALLNHTPTLRNELALSRAFLSAIHGLDRRLLLSAAERASIAIPVRFVWGDGDSFGGPDIAREFVAPFPDARLEIVAGAGHAVWMDDVALAAARVRSSLARPVNDPEGGGDGTG